MATLPTRMLGNRAVSSIGLGCMNLSHGIYGHIVSDEEGTALLNRALDLGVTFLDTAAVYGAGTNELLIGKAVMHRRQEFALASKCVLDRRDGQQVLDGRPESILKTLDEALVRLRTDHIDLYYLHRLDPAVPVEESVGALARAREAGKIGGIGLSEMSGTTIRRACAATPITAVQSEYAPWVRNPEAGALQACRDNGIAFVAFSPLGRGFLAGAVRDDHFEDGDLRNILPRFKGENLVHNLTLYAAFADLARDAGCTPAQLAIGWVLAQGEDVIPIPGTRSIAHLEEDLATATMSFDAALLARVDAIFSPGAVKGNRYGADLQKTIDTEILPEEIGED
ncbi:aldo/keto reductase [Sphingobium aquiterrae]|uniref:aldo/keto reductase n=1 Tax=Sphingobium aquiterrae TaxID=2038656 RepID=UPI003015D8F7